MHVFFKYLLSCLDAQFYPKHVLLENFSHFSSLFYLFVKEGFITPEHLTRFYYTYILALKDKLETHGASATVPFSDLINVLWALMTTEEESLHNPIIPRLFERLHEFKRADKPLSKEELLELYQVYVYAQDQVKVGRWPKEFKEVVPKQVREVCEEEHSIFDKNLYNDVQVDIVSAF